MSTSLPAQPATPSPSRRRLLPWGLLALALLAAAAAFLGTGFAYIAAGCLGLAMLLLSLLRPVWALYFFLGVTMLFREYGLQGHGVPESALTVYSLGLPVGITIYLFDFLLVAALAGVLLRALWKREPLHFSPESVPLLLFCAVGPLFVLWGMINGSKFIDAATDYRVAYRSVTILLLGITAIRSRRQAIIAAAIIVAGGALRVCVGDLKFLLHHGEEYYLVAGSVSVPFIEQADAQVCALVAVCSLAYALWAPRLRWKSLLGAAALFLLGAGSTVLTLRRSAWLTLAVGALIVVLFALRRRRTWILGLALFVSVPLFLVIGGERAHKLIDLGKVAARLVTAFGEAPSTGESPTTGDENSPTSESLHYAELKDALQNVRDRPWLGWGLGHLLVREASKEVEEMYSASGRLVRVHDVYLDLWVKMGLVGVGLFLWWIVLAARRMWRATRAMYRGREDLAWLYGGLFATWIGFLFASLGTTMIFGGNRIGIMYFGIVAVLTCWEYYQKDASGETRATSASPASRETAGPPLPL